MPPRSLFWGALPPKAPFDFSLLAVVALFLIFVAK